MNKKFFAIALSAILTLTLSACGGKKESAVVLNVAASSTPHAVILEQVVDDLAEQGIDLQIHEYGDYVIPNTAVEEGDEDVN